MLQLYRLKGRFVTKKKFQKDTNGVKVMNDLKKKKKEEIESEKTKSTIIDDNHHLDGNKKYVDLDVLGRNLICKECDEILSLNHIKGDRKMGNQSYLKVECQKCMTNAEVPIGSIFQAENNSKFSELNANIVIGAIHSGIGYAALTKLFACMDIPLMSEPTYKVYERKIGAVFEEVAKESCKEAAMEERKLVMERLDQLFEEL